MHKKVAKSLKVLMFLAIATVAALILAALVMWLWNELLPPLFGAHAVGYWQALGLLVLCRILVGGFRGGRGLGHRRRAAFMYRWSEMTPEEREKFRQGMRTGLGLDDLA